MPLKTKNSSQPIELLAPVGSYESLMAALKAGANSIYFGVEQLNMRARSADNFTITDMNEIAGICKKNNIKSYLTLNTILYDHDILLMKKMVDSAKKSGITAIIASDQAILNYAKKTGTQIHISTQANVSNIDTVEFYSLFSDVIVLARELSLKQVESIITQIQKNNIRGPGGELIKIEIFAHGALCMAVSGKCYLSLHSHFASANRGACVQNCRRNYTVKDKEEGIEFEIDNEYIMSSKDLCTIGFLDQVLRSGVSVLKIEGRGRSADYVYTTTKCYREAIDAISDGTYTPDKINEWNDRLATVFNRGFWDGYYLGKKMGEWNDIYGSKATKQKIYIGKGIKYFDKINIGEFLLETNSLTVGDEILITGPSSGLIETKVTELRVNDDPKKMVKKGDVFSMPLSEKIRPSDKLYKVIANRV